MKLSELFNKPFKLKGGATLNLKGFSKRVVDKEIGGSDSKIKVYINRKELLNDLEAEIEVSVNNIHFDLGIADVEAGDITDIGCICLLRYDTGQKDIYILGECTSKTYNEEDNTYNYDFKLIGKELNITFNGIILQE